MRAALKEQLLGARGPRIIALVALLISLPALALGFQGDDHLYRAAHAGGASALTLFNLSHEEFRAQQERGIFVWWSNPRAEVRFFRPLSYADLWLELSLFGGRPEALLFGNALLYAAIVWIAAGLYRRFLSGTSALLAALMFAVDEAHAMSVGWISARNTLWAALFSLAALALYLRAEAARSWQSRALCVGAVAFALLSGEAGTWSLALLIAYASSLGAGSLGSRLRRLWPELSLALLWSAGYVALGFRGVPGTTWYREVSAPATALQGLLDLPLWITTLFAGLSVTPLAFTSEQTARLIALPLAILPTICLVLTARWSEASRFFTLATGLCVLPLFATVPQERVTLGASFGAFGLLACFLELAAARPSTLARVARRVLLALHLVLPVLLFPIGLGAMRTTERATQALLATPLSGRQVVLVNSPIELLSNYAMRILERDGAHAPASFATLYAGDADVTLARVDATTLDAEVARGWGYAPFERIFCALNELPREGSERVFAGLKVRVLAADADGRPVRARFQFASVLEASDRQWLIWDGERARAFAPPTRGERLLVPGRGLLRQPWR